MTAALPGSRRPRFKSGLASCVLLLFPAFTGPGSARAQELPVFQSTPASSWYSAGECVAVGDLDGDGDLDIVAGQDMFINNGGTFTPLPPQSGHLVDATSVALGDVDGDGDLDIVAASGSSIDLYRNNGDGTFETTAAWSTNVGVPRAVALGDVNGDGRIDLVCGGDLWPAASGGTTSGAEQLPGALLSGARLYLNVGGTFADQPAWTGPNINTWGIALGDVDQDGKLDLVCANNPGGTTFYRNTGDTFSAAPAWSGPPVQGTSVALGDIDRDGDLDLVLGVYGIGARLYRNIGGTFEATHSWLGRPEFTGSITLGDVNDDGWLDVVCGSRTFQGVVTVGSTVYLNSNGTLASSPAWSGPDSYTTAVALADMNGDGDLDLICVNSVSFPSALYLNSGHTFGSSPDWLGPARPSKGTIVGDVNGDGYPDLVVGDPEHGPSVYLNVDGTISASPAWTGPPGGLSLALGDVDGDGDLDLLVDYRLYLNDGTGSFGSAPVWTGRGALSGVLADMDGDGRLDIVIGAGPAVYLNKGGTFGSSPDWEIPPAVGGDYQMAVGDLDADGDLDIAAVQVTGGGGTSFLAELAVFWNSSTASALTLTKEHTYYSPQPMGPPCLGDIDGDGDLDIVVPDPGQPFIFRNTAPRGSTPKFELEGVPASEGGTYVALGDVDGDGDLDLLSCGPDRGSSLYLNDGGSFSGSPAWRGAPAITQTVAVADIDGDGDLDLVEGNDFQSEGMATNQNVSIYLNRDGWWTGALPESAGRRLPNNPAYLRDVSISRTGPNEYTLSFAAVDLESDPVRVTGEYQFGGGPWTAMSLVSGQFAASPAGITHQAAWNVLSLPFDERPVIVRLRAASAPRKGGLIQWSPAFLKEVGKIRPTRPSLSALPFILQFPAMTVGDSATVDLNLSNRGTEDLIIESITKSTPYILPGLNLPDTLAPGARQSVPVTLAPRQSFRTGTFALHSNDPTQPAWFVAVFPLGIHELAFESQLMARAGDLSLGEAVTVVATPGPGVHVEGGMLYVRSSGAAALSDSIPLSPLGGNFVAVIPGADITEAGIDYYVRVANSGISAFAPADAPAHTYHRDVAAPAGISSEVVAGPGGDITANTALPVNIVLPQGAVFVRGAFFYRPGGAAGYDSLELEIPPGHRSPMAVIPAAAVGPRGVEYWARVETERTGGRPLSDPPDEPALHPRVIRTTVTSLAEPDQHAGGRYRLISVPLELNLPATGTLQAILSDQPEFGPYDPTRWRAFRYLPGPAAYAGIPDTAAAAGSLRPEPGRAFWLIARDANRLDTAPVPGRSVSTATPFALTLQPGWNQIGDPFEFPIAWSALTGDGPVDSLEPPISWDEAHQAYAAGDVTVLQPFDGYWVMNRAPGPVTVMIPPREAAPPAADRTATPDPAAWRIEIAATSPAGYDGQNFAGVAAGAREGADSFDRTDPPLSPGNAVSLYFTGSADAGQPAAAAGARTTDPRWAADIRSPVEQVANAAERGRRWNFDVTVGGADRVGAPLRLSFSGIDRVPADFEIRLFDRSLGRTIDLRHETEYACTIEDYASGGSARFELSVGSPAFLDAGTKSSPPPLTKIVGNEPNPFAGRTVIRFELAHPGRVTVDIFDVAGRRLRTLVNDSRKAGVQDVTWNGDDENGRRVPEGVYFVRLTGPDRVDTRKMLKAR